MRLLCQGMESTFNLTLNGRKDANISLHSKFLPKVVGWLGMWRTTVSLGPRLHILGKDCYRVSRCSVGENNDRASRPCKQKLDCFPPRNGGETYFSCGNFPPQRFSDF